MDVSRKIEILIIDDEVDFCQVIGAFLKRRGYKISFANTLKEGFKLLTKIKPQVLFMDNHLPDGRGWEHTPKLRASYPDLLINLISAFNDGSTYLLPKDAKIRIIEKPLSMNKIESYLI